jgi:hypothetical protein
MHICYIDLHILLIMTFQWNGTIQNYVNEKPTA